MKDMLRKTLLFSLAVLFSLVFINFADADASQSSVSSYNIQYTNSFGGSYSSLMSGVSDIPSQTDEYYDAQFYVPPLGCQPTVVRSDLLAEQDVPVFCKLVPLKINPGVSITRIKSLFVTQQQKSEYISGVSFHPAKAVIGSKGSLVNNPSTDNIGYVVVVLKKMPNENTLPEYVNVILSATMDYSGENMFGIGETELYVPELTDADFQNQKEYYSFFNGLGYLKVDELDDNSATISAYTTDNRRVFSQTLTKGTTSKQFYLNNFNGGEAIKFTLKEITLPETRATINVNGNLFNVYKNGKFYNGKCTLQELKALGAGSGTAKINCGSKTFNLVKKLNSLELEVNGKRKAVTLGEDIEAFGDNNYYLLAYFGQVEVEKAQTVYYSFISQIPRTTLDSLTESEKTKAIESMKTNLAKIVNSKKDNLQGIKSVKDLTFSVKGKSVKINISYIDNAQVKSLKIGEGENPINIVFVDAKFSNAYQTENTLRYFNNALDSYGFVSGMFASELKDSKYRYGEYSLWQEYYLAKNLGQKETEMKILSDIMNEYPQSKSSSDKTAKELIDEGKLLSNNEGSSGYSPKEDIYVELISVIEPSFDENNVLVHTSANSNSIQRSVGDTIYDQGNKRITLSSFTDESVSFNCTFPTTSTSNVYKNIMKPVSKGNSAVISECDNIRVFVDGINRKKVARISLTPVTNGKIKASNFTINIGIEKRAIKLTPEIANERIKELDKSIDKWTNITKSLGKFIEVEKAACLATSLAINVKNLFASQNGMANARTSVIARWKTLCESSEFQARYDNAKNVDDCIANAYEKEIAPEIEAAKNNTKDYNKIDEEARKKAAPIVNLTQRDIQIKTDIAKKINSIKPGTINEDSKKVNEYTHAELSNIYFNLKMQSTLTGTSAEYYQKNAENQLNLINGRFEAEAKALGTAGDGFGSERISGSAKEVWRYKGLQYKDISSKYTSSLGITINSTDAVAVVGPHVYVFNGAPGKEAPMNAQKVYKIGENNQLEKEKDSAVENDLLSKNVFQAYDSSMSKNKCTNCNYVRAFTAEPYKGLPQIIPFDCENGWYVWVDQSTAGFFGEASSKSYFDSGALNSFWICNVGPNKLMEGKGIGDDGNCIKFDMSTGQQLNTLPGLSESEAKSKINSAINAVKDVQTKLKNNPGTIKVNDCPNMEVRATTGSFVGGSCSDFMSPKYCQLIFNVCDPVVCPNSRCDLGGKYRVDNVIQSGIIGSSVLCLPNFIGFNGKSKTGVVIPVCLTGIHAGIESWVSVLGAYRDCLNESITMNKTTGICDMLHSVYVCDFFWRQVAPFSESILKNLFINIVAGSNAEKGGAEYNFAAAAYQNMQNSMAWMKNTYAKDSNLVFGVGDIANSVVARACKSSFSATYPDNFDAMLEPESPVQYTATYEELVHTDATVPPTSQYKVFYTIFAGNDQGHYYSVYLKDAPSGIGYSSKDTSLIASGYVSQGQTVTETKDFLDVSGFRQLCVRIDAKDNCNFKSVSTSFALNYAKDKAVQDQVTNPVTTEKECISGTQSAGALLTPNIQQGVTEFLNPELYNQGITRVCSGVNPGKATEPSRWKDVGYCGDSNIRCWVDLNSVKKAIKGLGIENETLSQINAMNLNNIIQQSGYLKGDQVGPAIDQLRKVYLETGGVVDLIKKAEGDLTKKYASHEAIIGTTEKDVNKDYFNHGLNNLEEDVKTLSERIGDSKAKAEIWLIRAEVYEKIAILLKEKTPSQEVVSPPADEILPSEEIAEHNPNEITLLYNQEKQQLFSFFYDNHDMVSLKIEGASIYLTYNEFNKDKMLEHKDLVGTLINNKITISEEKLLDVDPAYLTPERMLLVTALNGKTLSQISAGKPDISLDSSNKISIAGKYISLILNEKAMYYDYQNRFDDYTKVAIIDESGKIVPKANFTNTFYSTLSEAEQTALFNNLYLLKKYTFSNNEFVYS